MDEERFYCSTSTGFSMPGGSRLEREWTVHDRMESHKVVALFIVRKDRGMNTERWDTVQAYCRRRAKLHCLALNRAENGHPFAWADLKTRQGEDEWSAVPRLAC
jgi:hypothetical protein